MVAALQHPWVTGRGTAPLPIIQRTPLLPGPAPVPPASAQSHPTPSPTSSAGVPAPPPLHHQPHHPPPAAHGGGRQADAVAMEARALGQGAAPSYAQQQSMQLEAVPPCNHPPDVPGAVPCQCGQHAAPPPLSQPGHVLMRQPSLASMGGGGGSGPNSSLLQALPEGVAMEEAAKQLHHRLSGGAQQQQPWAAAAGHAALAPPSQPPPQQQQAAAAEADAGLVVVGPQGESSELSAGQRAGSAGGAGGGGGSGGGASLVGQKRLRYTPQRMISQEELDRAIAKALGGPVLSERMGEGVKGLWRGGAEGRFRLVRGLESPPRLPCFSPPCHLFCGRVHPAPHPLPAGMVFWESRQQVPRAPFLTLPPALCPPPASCPQAWCLRRCGCSPGSKSSAPATPSTPSTSSPRSAAMGRA